jgi:HAD superfamily hydrolase (TIGR01509 family)
MTHPALTRVPQPDGVLFDAGGTLVQVHVERLAAGLEAVGCEPDPDLLDRAFWETIVLLDTEFLPPTAGFGDWWERWLARLAGSCGVPADAFRDVYDALDGEALLWEQPLEGAADALDRLRSAGLPLGVVSNADGRIAQALERAGLADRFDVIIDSTVVGVHKPDPAIFDHALGPLGLDPARTWYLGDTVAYDAAAAEAAGLTSWVIDHRGLHTVDHPRRVASLHEFADVVLAARRL